MPVIVKENKDGCEILINKKSSNVFYISLELPGRPHVLYRTADNLKEACRIVKVFREAIPLRDELYPIATAHKSCSCCGN